MCGVICWQFIPEQLDLDIQLGCVQGTQAHLSASRAKPHEEGDATVQRLPNTHQTQAEVMWGHAFLGIFPPLGETGKWQDPDQCLCECVIPT